MYLFKKIGIASDHAGYERKEQVKKFLQENGFEVKDYGTYSEERCDYPDFGHQLAESIEKGINERGVAVCGSGNGINMSINKHSSIRGALCWCNEISELARQHNDANICTLPGRFVSEQQAIEIVKIFMSTPFDGGRHKDRIDKIPLC